MFVCFFLCLLSVLFRMFQGEMIPHYRRRVAFICNWVSRKIACGLRSFFGVVNGQCRTNKLCRHKHRALEPLPSNSSRGSSFEKHISLQSLDASVKDEEILMLNVYKEVSNSAFESFIITSAIQIPDILCQPRHRD